jgi:exopolysaccharide production protein ExoQ
VWWMRIARREVLMTVAMIVVAALLPLHAIVRAIVASFYVVVVMTIAALILSPATTTRHIYPGNSLPPLPGWHGLFDHKTGMALFLLMGLITVLTFESSGTRRTVATVTVVVLIIGSQSSTGLSALVFVLAFHLWLKNYLVSRGQRGSAYVLASLVIGGAAVFLMWAFMPTLLEARGKDLTLSGRTLIWSASIDAIRDRPLTGYGIGGVWRDAATDPTAVMLRKIGFTVFHSHSTVLELMLLLGAIGLVRFLVVYISAVSGAIKALDHDSALARWALLILGMQFVLSLSEVAAFGPWLPLMAAICVLTVRANREPIPDGSAQSVAAAPEFARRSL